MALCPPQKPRRPMPMPAVSLTEANDHVAAKVLPHARAVIFDQVASSETPKNNAAFVANFQWEKDIACVDVCAAASGAVVWGTSRKLQP